MRYFKLIDKENFNDIIRRDIGMSSHEIYRYGVNQWVKTGIMAAYTNPENYKFGKYMSITKDEADDIIDKQRALMFKLCDISLNLAKQTNESFTIANELPNLEHKATFYTYYALKQKVIQPSNLKELGFTNRIIHAVLTLLNFDVMNDSDWKYVLWDSNAWYVAVAIIKYKIANETNAGVVEYYCKALKYLVDNN